MERTSTKRRSFTWLTARHSSGMIRVLFFFLFSLIQTLSFAVPIYYEAESGVLTGTNTSTGTAGYTGTGFVTGFDAAGDAVQITVNVPAHGNYSIYIRYRSPFGDKTQDLYVNGSFLSNVLFANTAAFATVTTTAILNAGNNTISIRNNWGYVDLDNFGIEIVPPNVYNITPNLINPSADAKTKALYSLLKSQYGHCIFTGQTQYWPELMAITGESPAVRGFDMQNYSPMNPWGWSGCCAAWGAWDDGTVQQAIDWYNATGGKGIVTFHWHWFSPSGGSLQSSTFYTANTAFDVSRAVVVGNQEYTDVLRDIDAIAVQLKRLQTAGVPVLWRPLHEAGGGWFWWGAKGAAPAKALYDIVYNRLTTYHNINNLIWVWSTPEPSWYPGNSKVDILGYDSYPGAYNYTTQKGMFDQLNTIVGSQKMITLSENGPIPDIAQAFADDAPWLYFMSWVDLVTQQNTNAHILTAFSQGCNLTDVAALPVSLLSFRASRKNEGVELNWSTAWEEHNFYFEIERSEDGLVFGSIGNVEGALNAISTKSYTYMDNDPPQGKLYYRLKQVDLNKDFRYSEVVTVSTEYQDEITIYPNPGNGVYYVNGKFSSLRVINAEGRTVMSRTFGTSSEARELEIDLAAEPAGIYFLDVTEGSNRYTQKLIHW